jgi:4'-phosphopantetheinyl transferase EntD
LRANGGLDIASYASSEDSRGGTLAHALAHLLEPHAALHASARPIQPGDEQALTPAEAAQFAAYALRRRRASGAVRAAARNLCTKLGLGPHEFLRDADGIPGWPPGWLGSFSHDDVAAVAILGRRPPLQGLGIDIEAPDPLEPELTRSILAHGEEMPLALAGLDGKAAFSIKEAVFKAVYPADRIFLEFAQVRLDPGNRTALTYYGRTVQWRVVTRPRMLALAWW